MRLRTAAGESFSAAAAPAAAPPPEGGAAPPLARMVGLGFVCVCVALLLLLLLCKCGSVGVGLCVWVGLVGRQGGARERSNHPKAEEGRGGKHATPTTPTQHELPGCG